MNYFIIICMALIAVSLGLIVSIFNNINAIISVLENHKNTLISIIIYIKDCQKKENKFEGNIEKSQ